MKNQVLSFLFERGKHMRKRLFSLYFLFAITNAIFTESSKLFYFNLQVTWYVQLLLILLWFIAMFLIKRGAFWFLEKIDLPTSMYLWMPIYFSFVTLFMVLLGNLLPFLTLNFNSALYFGFASCLYFFTINLATKYANRKSRLEPYPPPNHFDNSLHRSYH